MKDDWLLNILGKAILIFALLVVTLGCVAMGLAIYEVLEVF
jgi:hypothetical protein